MNWKAVDPTLTVLKSPFWIGVGARHITVSTVACFRNSRARREAGAIRLAISIHAPNDDLRQSLMRSTRSTRRQCDRRSEGVRPSRNLRILMLGGVNDGAEQAVQLASFAKECRAFVNLIRFIRRSRRFHTHLPEQIHWFARRLTGRRGRGRHKKESRNGHAAACGHYGWNGSGGGRQSAPRMTVTPGSVTCRVGDGVAFQRPATRRAHSGWEDDL